MSAFTLKQQQESFHLQHRWPKAGSGIDSAADTILLTGPAGSGKTTAIRQLAANALEEGYRVHLLAPTGRAARILGRRAALPASTIHRAIFQRGKTRMRSCGRLVTTFDLPPTPKFGPHDVVIVDEATLISQGAMPSDGELIFGSGHLLLDLMSMVQEAHLVVVGDPAQLRLGDGQCDLFLPAEMKQYYGRTVLHWQLDRVYRQSADTDLSRLLEALRRPALLNGSAVGCATGLSLRGDGTVVMMAADQDPSGPPMNSGISLAWTNKAVISCNYQRRLHLLGERAPDLVAGEVLIADRSHDCGVLTGDVCRVLAVQRNVRCEQVAVRDRGRITLTWHEVFAQRVDDGQELCMTILANYLGANGEMPGVEVLQALHIDIQRRCQGLKRGSDAMIQRMVEDPWYNALRPRYAYALTGHKSQGGQWPVVRLVGTPAGRGGYWDARWLYTVASRAQECLQLPPSWAERLGIVLPTVTRQRTRRRRLVSSH